jgi:hypothetical protein
VAKTDASRVAPYVEALGPCLRDSNDSVRTNVAFLFRRVAAAAPGAVGRQLATLADHLGDTNATVRRNLTLAFAGVAETDPQRVKPYLDAIEPRLADDNERVQGAASTVFRAVEGTDDGPTGTRIYRPETAAGASEEPGAE